MISPKVASILLTTEAICGGGVIAALVGTPSPTRNCSHSGCHTRVPRKRAMCKLHWGMASLERRAEAQREVDQAEIDSSLGVDANLKMVQDGFDT